MQGKAKRPTYSAVNPELYVEENNLLIHAKVSTSESLISCPDCKKPFADHRSLHRHSVIHKGIRPFSCQDCGKAFMLRGDLTRHLLIHSGKRPYACNICERRFTLKGNLMQHVRTHTPEKQFTCTLCRKSFSQRESLYRHIRAHFGEKPYCCETCGKNFSLRGDLTRHVMIHTGQRPHRCPICGRSFALKGNMTQHIRTHTNYAELMTIGDTSSTKQTTMNFPDHLSINGHPSSKEIWQVSTTTDKNIPTQIIEPQIGVHYTCTSSTQEVKLISSLNCSTTISTENSVAHKISNTDNPANGNVFTHTKTDLYSSRQTTEVNVTEFANGSREEQELTCTLCEKPFMNKRYLKLHIERHKLAQTDFMCVHCRKSFLSKSEHFFHSCKNVLLLDTNTSANVLTANTNSGVTTLQSGTV